MLLLCSTFAAAGGRLWSFFVLVGLLAAHLVASTPLSTQQQQQQPTLAQRGFTEGSRSSGSGSSSPALQKRERWVWIGYRYVEEDLYQSYLRRAGSQGYIHWEHTGRGEQLGPGIYIAKSLRGANGFENSDIVFQVEADMDSLEQYASRHHAIAAVPEHWNGDEGFPLWGNVPLLAEYLARTFGAGFRVSDTIRASYINFKQEAGEKQLLWPKGLEATVRLRMRPGKIARVGNRRSIDDGEPSWRGLPIVGSFD